MALLRASPDDLGVLLTNAATWYSAARGVNILPEVLEKDFWVTEALRHLAAPQQYSAPTVTGYPVTARAVFKGGTSLSKAFGIIERFSEDIDVFLVIDPVAGAVPSSVRAGQPAPTFTLGAARVDTIMRTTAARLAATLGLPHESYGTSRAGTKRSYMFTYPPAVDHTDTAVGGLGEAVLLELVRMGTPTPNAAHTLTSLLSTYVAAEGVLALAEFDELAPFRMDVLAPERTLVDKLAILHDVASRTLAGGGLAALSRQARHYYDVHQLLTTPAVTQSLEATPGLVATYAAAAQAESIAVRRAGIQRPTNGFAASPAFCDPGFLESARGEYEREMSRLAMGAYPPLDSVLDAVRASAHLL